MNFAELPPDEAPAGEGLSARQRKLVERVTLELYCQYEASLAFREPVPPENLHYHAKVPTAVAHARLHYTCQLIYHNCHVVP